MRILIGSLAALLALSGAAQAHYPGSDTWHDFGTDLGALGASPVMQELGVCWYSESQAPVDPGPPLHTHLGDILGHYYGVGVGEGCGGMVGGPACETGSENPGIYVLVGTVDTFPLVAFCHGADPGALPEPPSGPPELPEPLACIVADPPSALVCAGAPPIEPPPIEPPPIEPPPVEPPAVPPEVQCVLDAGPDPAGILLCLGAPQLPGAPELPPELACVQPDPSACIPEPPGVPPLPPELACVQPDPAACIPPLPAPPELPEPPAVPEVPAEVACILAATTPKGLAACTGNELPPVEPPAAPPQLQCIVDDPTGIVVCVGPLPVPAPPLPAEAQCVVEAAPGGDPAALAACAGPVPALPEPPAPPTPPSVADLCAMLPPDVQALPACAAP